MLKRRYPKYKQLALVLKILTLVSCTFFVCGTNLKIFSIKNKGEKMKILAITLFLLVLSVQNIVAIHGEIWFYIDDNSNTNYKVVASRISTTEPLFGYNFMEVGNNQYDEVTSDIDVLGYPCNASEGNGIS
ncbi:MAG: hypothetical protein DYG97_14535 [Ignavibacteria bacterium CHB3]|nr:MAG: hypothetical protein EDM72_09585 [Chlorobiota bacterium]MCE7857727.1 hypothetical protein [Ignavibacteria bacterium CHB3]